VPRTAMINAGITVLLWPGSRPWSAPSRIADGMKSHACEAPCWIRSASGVMGRPQKYLVICLNSSISARRRSDGAIEAVIQMVVDHAVLGVRESAFQRLELLCELDAGYA
jgi:hypothetical protein